MRRGSKHSKATKTKISASLRSRLRHAKTSIVRKVVPRPIRNAIAGLQLYGKSKHTQSMGHAKTAKQMRKRALQWATGKRDHTKHGTGNNSYHKPRK